MPCVCVQLTGLKTSLYGRGIDGVCDDLPVPDQWLTGRQVSEGPR